MIVLGLPTYYAQFGFKHASIWGVQFVSPTPDDIFMAVALDAAALANAMSTVTLSPAFDEQ